MSEEREMELVTGTIGGITQKKADTWTVAVTPEGSQYAKNLWTKDADLVDSLSAKIGQSGAFVCGASYWNRQDGQQVRSLWITNEPAESFTPGAPSTAPAANVSPSSAPKDEMSKDDWARKDAAIHMMACIKTAAAALTHTLPSDPTEEDLRRFLQRESFLSGSWHRHVLAVRDGVDVPFEGAPLSAHDDDIPFGE